MDPQDLPGRIPKHQSREQAGVRREPSACERARGGGCGRGAGSLESLSLLATRGLCRRAVCRCMSALRPDRALALSEPGIEFLTYGAADPSILLKSGGSYAAPGTPPSARMRTPSGPGK